MSSPFSPTRSETHPAVSRRSFGRRLLGAALLDPHLYEEVEADRTAGLPALAAVTGAALASGIGSFENGGWVGIAVTAVADLVGWYVWAYVTFFIGTKILPEPQTHADHGELLRTLGFATAPGLLRVFGLIPGLNPWLYVLTGLWMLVAMVVALRQALDYHTTTRAIAVCAIGWPVHVIFVAISLLAAGPWPM